MATPTSIDQEPVRAELENALKAKPLAEGQTDEVDARALVNQKTIIQEPRQIVEVPARAAYCEMQKIPRQITERVKVGTESFSCALQPWKWGTCWRDVYKDVVRTVIDDVRVCFPEQVEVTKTVLTPVVKLKEAIQPTKIRLRYRLDLEHLALSMSGSRIRISPRVRATVDADLREGFLGASIAIRGALHCESILTPTADADVSLTSAASGIGVAADVKSVSLDVKQLCLPGAVEGVDLAVLLDPIDRLIADQVRKALDERLAEAVQKQANDHLAGVHLDQTLRKLVEPLRSPVSLAPAIWLEPGVQELSLSQLTGGSRNGTPTLDIVGALKARPRVSYGSKPQPGPLSPLSVTLGAAGNQFHLEPVGIIPLSDARSRMKAAVGELIQRAGPRYRNVRYDVDVYQSGSKLAVGIRLQKPGLFGWKATVYLLGDPAFNARTNSIELSNLKFDLASRNIILKVAGWVLDRKVEEFLQARAHFPVNDQLARALKELGKFRIESPSGIFSGSIISLALGQIWVSNDALNLTVLADGTSRFEARIPH